MSEGYCPRCAGHRYADLRADEYCRQCSDEVGWGKFKRDVDDIMINRAFPEMKKERHRMTSSNVKRRILGGIVAFSIAIFCTHITSTDALPIQEAGKAVANAIVWGAVIIGVLLQCR